uniref:Uncharacterized protein n=1 Tax=Haematobia irritans TaxID=7368 RepID=A0A1L8E9I1_HAEIR
MIFPIVGERFVEFTILRLGNVVGIASPNWFRLIQFLIFGILDLDSFLLLAILVLLISILIFTYIFNFRFISIHIFLFLIFLIIFGFIIRYFLVTFFFHQQFDGITNELGMFIYNFLNLALLQVVSLILFNVQNNLGTATQRFRVVGANGE